MNNLVVCMLNKNDGKSLETLKEKIKKIKKDFNIVLVDSNSTDNSHKIAKEINMKIINLNNLSRGECIKECINIFKNQFDYIVFTSSDGEEDLDDLYKFGPLFAKGADMVIASRLMRGGYFKSDRNIFWFHRKLYLIFITFIINFFFGGKLKDCWNGYRGFRLKCFDHINIEEKFYLTEAETSIKFLKKNFLILEFPTKENPRKFGKSSNPIIQSGLGHIILIIKNLIN